jgi:hypothetical protein
MRTWTRGWVCLGVLGIFALLPAAAYQNRPTQQISWVLLPPQCAPPVSGFAVGCGDYGTFVFNVNSPTGCTPIVEGEEVPKTYPKPATMMQEQQQVPFNPLQPATSTSLAGQGQLEPRAARDSESLPLPPTPCQAGSCLSPRGGASGQEPWVAVVDWNDWHGWTTGWTVAHISGLPVHLEALDSQPLRQNLGATVGDGHVLASLCGVAEAVDEQAAPAPLVINMSFGRLAGDVEPWSAASCDPTTLSCQILQVVSHLDQSHAILMASAGNHQAELFPAIAQEIIEVGNLDLTAFEWTQEVHPSWETPLQASALFPGYGLCLEYPADEGSTELWPAPAGSSYSSAFFAGWVAYDLARGIVQAPAATPWAPRWSEAKGCYGISADTKEPCNRVANQILDRILGTDPRACWSQRPRTPLLVVEGPPQGVASPLTFLPSLDAWVDRGHSPAPMSDFCVPCVTSGDGSGWLTYGDGSDGSDGSDGVRVATAEPDLVLDLGSSATVPSPDFIFHALYLRTGDSFYSVLHRANGDMEKLAGIAGGDYKSLILRGFNQVLSPATQHSLVYLMCLADGTGDDCFWTSTPLLADADP